MEGLHRDKGQIEPNVRGLRPGQGTLEKVGGHLRNLEDAGETWRTQAKSGGTFGGHSRDQKGQMRPAIGVLEAGQRTLRKLEDT